MPFVGQKLTSFLFYCLLAFVCGVYGRYDDAQCCALARSSNSFLSKSSQSQATICGQEYNASVPAAPDLYVPYSYCHEHCGGFGLSKGSKPSSWAAPIVQFILPSVIFSTTIPRRKMLGLFATRNLAATAGSGSVTTSTMARKCFRHIKSELKRVVQLLVVMADNFIWIAFILALAGPMMISGLYEAVLDWKILSLLRSEVGGRLGKEAVIELLVTVVSGNLHQSDNVNPQTEIVAAVHHSVNTETKRARLLGLMDSQMGYGPIVGAPVVFYLGSFIYTILDLSNNPSDQDAAISLAFGVEWMIIVHVAIIGSCVLATNNPSTASVLASNHATIPRASTMQVLGGPSPPGPWSRVQTGDLPILVDIYTSRYQPVTMWNRGRNKKGWITQSAAATGQPSQGHRLTAGWRAKVLIASMTAILINLPPVAGAVVAWRTPPVGWGCRSLSFVCYAGAQLLVTSLFVVRHNIPSPEILTLPSKTPQTWRGRFTLLWDLTKLCSCFLVHGLYFLSIIGSIFVALGGTLMQVIGVYRNCFCYVNAPEWYSLDNASVQVASDTQEQRASSNNWITFGGIATVFMAVCCLVGWWYSTVVRGRYREIVYRRFA